MTDTLTKVEIPADVRDNSETVTDYAFMKHRSPGRGVETPGYRDSTLTHIDTFGYTHYQWHDTNQRTGQRCRFDMLVNRAGVVTHLFHTEYFTRTACTDCEYCYAESFIAVTDADGVTHPAAPFCDEHGRTVKRITDRQPGYSWAESEHLIIGQHD